MYMEAIRPASATPCFQIATLSKGHFKVSIKKMRQKPMQWLHVQKKVWKHWMEPWRPGCAAQRNRPEYRIVITIDLFSCS